MDFLNINKKKLDIKNKNNEIVGVDKKSKYGDATRAIKATGGAFSTIAGPGGFVYEKAADIAERQIDITKDKDYREFKEIKKMDQVEWFKNYRNLTDTDIEMFEKALQQEEENEKRLKEQQMDKNLTSPTSSLTKPVMLASSNSVATDGFVDYGVSNDTFSTLQIANESNDKFIVTRADIYENLESIFSIECFAYINLVKNPLYENLDTIYNNDKSYSSIYKYLDKSIKLSIKRPSSTNKNIVPDGSSNDMHFSGIVSDVEYLGVDDETSTNIDKKYFFKFKLASPL